MGLFSLINPCTLRIESADRVRGIIEGGKQYAPTDIIQARRRPLQMQIRQKQFYGRTQAEALKSGMPGFWPKTGLNHQTDNIVFRDYAMNWIRVYRADAGAPQQKQYMNMMEAFADYLPKKSMREITAMDIQNFCNQ